VYEVATMNCTLLKGHTDLVLALATSKVDPNILVTSSKVGLLCFSMTRNSIPAVVSDQSVLLIEYYLKPVQFKITKALN